MPVSRVTIDLLRHGEVSGAVCLGGDRDAPLTPRGWAQMRSALPDGSPWSGIVSSPLGRCAAFAEAAAARHGLEPRFDPRLREIGFGAWEGRPWSELWALAGERLRQFQHDPGSGNPAPGGEPYAEFEQRVGEAWQELLETPGAGHWLVVTHAGTMRAILRRVLGLPVRRLFRIYIPYGCLSRIQRTGMDLPALVFHRGTP